MGIFLRFFEYDTVIPNALLERERKQGAVLGSLFITNTI